MTVNTYGDAVLYNANTLDVMKDMISRGVQLDCIVTDPPYRVTSHGSSGTAGGMFLKEQTKKGKIFEENDIDIEDYLPLFYKLLKPDSHCYIMTNNKNLSHFLRVIDDFRDPETHEGFNFVKSIIWEKGNKIMGGFYMSCYEHVLFMYKGRGNPINNCGTPDILPIPNIKAKDVNEENLHDTEKPVELFRILLCNSTSEGQLVMDPFMGIGGCGVACQKAGRKFIGVELDEKYYRTACLRNEEAANSNKPVIFMG